LPCYVVLIVPLVAASLIGAYSWNWLSRNEALSVASGESALQNGAALLALGFALEGIIAFTRWFSALVNKPAGKR